MTPLPMPTISERRPFAPVSERVHQLDGRHGFGSPGRTFSKSRARSRTVSTPPGSLSVRSSLSTQAVPRRQRIGEDRRRALQRSAADEHLPDADRMGHSTVTGRTR